jgi:hypothetical protein
VSQSNESYERRLAAARFMLEAPQDADFEYRQMLLYPSAGWDSCSAEEAFRYMIRGDLVRIKPTPKKVLRPAWEVLKTPKPAQVIYNDGGANPDEVYISFINPVGNIPQGFNVVCLFKWAGKTREEIFAWGDSLPEEWFTEVEG